MKQFLLPLALLLSLQSAGVHAADVSPELAAVREKVSGLFDEIQPEHVFPGPIDGWYTIRKGAIIAYISANGRYLMQGDLIDLDGQVNLSENERDNARSEMMSAIPDSNTIVFSPKEVKYRAPIAVACIARSTSTSQRALKSATSCIRAMARHRQPGQQPRRYGVQRIATTR